MVAAAYGATHLLADGGTDAESGRTRSEVDDFALAKLGVRVISEGEWAYDPLAEVWRPLGLIEPGTERGELSDGELGELLDSGAPVPDWLMPAGVAAELRRARPPRSERGIVVFCTGLSGSGKSTLARDLRDALLERGDRTVSLLDGDLVRRLLSAGLTFSREDRDLNILRIGFVATEVARHGGIAICAPIAPYAAARAAVRRMVAEAGDFMLVHVATPLEVCEARDRKGLYAQARAGIIGSFTGISDPYEEPDDADLVIDTSVASRQDAVAAVLGQLTRGGWLISCWGFGPGHRRSPRRQFALAACSASSMVNTRCAPSGGAPKTDLTVSSSNGRSSATRTKSRMEVPVHQASASGAPWPLSRSLTSRVRKSMLYRARPDDIGDRPVQLRT